MLLDNLENENVTEAAEIANVIYDALRDDVFGVTILDLNVIWSQMNTLIRRLQTAKREVVILRNRDRRIENVENVDQEACLHIDEVVDDMLQKLLGQARYLPSRLTMNPGQVYEAFHDAPPEYDDHGKKRKRRFS